VTHGLTHRFYVDRDSPVHRLPAECKIAAVLSFVLVVVATPPTEYAAFACFALLLVAVTALARVPLRVVVPRLVVETPVVVFALLLPFVAEGRRTEVIGLSLSVSGLLSSWNVVAKATVGVLASILLAATTSQRDLLVGLQRLKVPALVVQIVAFMVRYIDVIADQMARMRLARAARGFVPRGPRSWPVLARSAGALFIRSFERGERVHLAMLSRGYTGALPELSGQRGTLRAWASAAALPLAAVVTLAVSVAR
jgi:cobalt/nickel transport system permease protein